MNAKILSRLYFVSVLVLPLFGTVAAEPVGVKPLGADGRALNLDFEDGTLRD